MSLFVDGFTEGNISLPILIGDSVSKSKSIITDIIPIPSPPILHKTRPNPHNFSHPNT